MTKNQRQARRRARKRTIITREAASDAGLESIRSAVRDANKVIAGLPHPTVTFAGGTRRSELALPFHRIPSAGLRRIARRFALGAVKYSEPSPKSHNWRASLDTEEHAREFLHDAYNHAFEHMLRAADGSLDGDDDLSAVGWFVTVAAYAEEKFGKRWTEL